MPESLKKVQKNWDEFAKKDPLWAILPIPEKKDNRWKIEELFATGRNEIKAIMNYIQGLDINIKKDKALDFGCGVGRLTQALCEYFNECIGVDISSYMLQLANRYNKYPQRCKYILNCESDLKIFPDETFDFIYSNIVFQHLEPRFTLGYIKEFIRVLKTGGLIIFQVTTRIIGFENKFRRALNYLIPQGIRRVYKKIRYKTWAIKDMYCIDPKILNEFIKSHGGEIIDIVEDSSSLPRYEGKRYCITR
uniref:Class I SAM-dependent methyltransferase n=1 Tax=candidate division WOR-3 bacterium TaxID=2052148 RepID=A0A7C4X8S6_UNCW3